MRRHAEKACPFDVKVRAGRERIKYHAARGLEICEADEGIDRIFDADCAPEQTGTLAKFQLVVGDSCSDLTHVRISYAAEGDLA
eukprot:2163074-Rhodomonas_salina.1